MVLGGCMEARVAGSSAPDRLMSPSPAEPCISRKRPNAGIPEPTMLPPGALGPLWGMALQGITKQRPAPPCCPQPRVLSSVARESPQQGLGRESPMALSRLGKRDSMSTQVGEAGVWGALDFREPP